MRIRGAGSADGSLTMITVNSGGCAGRRVGPTRNWPHQVSAQVETLVASSAASSRLALDAPGHRVAVADNGAPHFGNQTREMRRLTRSPLIWEKLLSASR